MRSAFALAVVFGLQSFVPGERNAAKADEALPLAVVKDRSGKIVGPLIDPGGIVGLKLANQPWASLGLMRLELYPNDTVPFGWLSEDCTGLPYVGDVGLPPYATKDFYNEDRLYVPHAREIPTEVKTRSTSTYAGDRCNHSAPLLDRGVQANIVSIASLGLEQPFSVDLVSSPPAGRPFVVDSRGKTVGPYFSSNVRYLAPGGEQVILRLKPTNEVVEMDVSANGFVISSGRSYRLFKTSDCTGPAYTKRGRQPPLTKHASIDPGGKQVINYPGEPLEKITIKSYRSGKACVTTDTTDNYVPLETVPIDAQGFTPPFAIKVQ